MLRHIASLFVGITASITGAYAQHLPLPSTDQTISRIALGSCLDEEWPAPIFDQVVASDPDLFLFLGDNVYADVQEGEWTRELRLDWVESAYRVLGAHPDYQKLMSTTPVMATWDDHDYGLNDFGDKLPDRQGVKDLMVDFFDVPDDHPMRTRDGVYHAATFGPEGKRVQIILLDTRWFRSDLKVTDERGAPGRERYLPDGDPAKTILGAAQWSWLAAELEKPADLRIIASSIQLIAEGHGWESWRNLPLERQRFFDLISQSGAENVVLVSGDRHVGGLYQIKDQTPYPLLELTASSLNKSFAKTNAVPEMGPNQIGHLFGPVNFGLISIDWEKGLIELELKDGDGQVVRSLTAAMEDLRPGRPVPPTPDW